ncbi:MAG TPA: type IV toxin-antitoxin system AbiEi family antitoxin domain-containing protein [Euzebyales bacterium]|nr:type IV toxin-antitoxin system AbiEi family antitoxin domain-containing protein [Euzebyales bacterium]
MPDNSWIALFELATHQWGVIARAQARQRGINDRTFTRRVRSERWQQPHRGVYVVPGAIWGPMPRLSAALLAVGPHAAATGVTALHVHGVVDRQPARLMLVVPHGRRARRLHAVDVVRSRTLRTDDITVVRGLRCTTPPRAFLDAAPATLDDPELRAMLIDARQRGIAQPAEVGERAALATPTLPGRRRLLDAIAAVTEVGADSVLSDLVHRRLVADGLSPDPTPTPVTVEGRRLHPDITFASARVCIECDSLAHHADQRALDLDHRKDHAYTTARWRCLRVGWRRYDRDWPGFVAAVRQALEEWPRVCAALGP